MKPQLIVEQKITAFVNKYDIFAVQADGTKGEMLARAQQKRLAFKEKVTFYTDDSNKTVAFTFRAEKVMDVHGRYFVEDADGTRLGVFKKKFGSSLLRSTWLLMNHDESETYRVTESNAVLAFLRRFVGWIPFVGDILDIVILFFRYHFVFLDSQGNEKGRYAKTTLFRDHYRMDVDQQLSEAIDWRVLAAMAVGLDALQSR